MSEIKIIKKTESYKCAACGNTYVQDRTEEEVLKELKNNYPGLSVDDCEIVCDDCYKVIRG